MDALFSSLGEGLFEVVRSVAALLVFFGAFFVSGLLFPLLYKALGGEAMPRFLLFWCKFLTAVGCAALIFFYFPPLTGRGGPGFGFGSSGGGGKGNSSGPANNGNKGTGGPATNTSGPIVSPPNQLTIFMLDARATDNKYYKINKQSPALDLAGVEKRINELDSKSIMITIEGDDNSVAIDHPAYKNLVENSLKKKGIPLKFAGTYNTN